MQNMQMLQLEISIFIIKDKKDILLILINQYYISALKNITIARNHTKSLNKKNHKIIEIIIDEIIHIFKKSPALF